MNPFAQAYLSESNLPIDELLALYSFHPFRSVRDALSNNNNVVLLGRAGIGKTMVLRLFEPSFVAQLYSSTEAEHKKQREQLPAPVIGVYLSLSSFEARLKSFARIANQSDAQTAMFEYGDYLNCLVTFRFLESLETLTACREWCDEIAGSSIEQVRLDGFAEALGTRLNREVDDFGEVDSVRTLKDALKSRTKRWTRSLNRRKREATPSDAAPFGTFLQHAAQALRETELLTDEIRIFCVIDQYDSLRRIRDVCDLRPIFNQAMHEATRSGSKVEYKLGSRRYGVNNRFLIDGKERLEETRELIIADLDEALSDVVYRDFVLDLFKKRLVATGLKGSGPDGAPPDANALVTERLPGLMPRDEAELYTTKSGARDGRHLTPFVQRWRTMGLPEPVIAEVLGEAGLTDGHPLSSVITAIALTRWLRDGTKEPPLQAEPPEDHGAPYAPIYYAEKLLESVELRYDLGTDAAAASSTHLRAVDNFARDVEQAALFFLASSYKNQQKYFCGFETLLAVSSRVALVFIELLNAAYEDLIADGKDPLRSPISPKAQSRAVYYISSNHHERISREHDFGETLRAFVIGLGSAMRELQIELTVPHPAPNGFSVSTKDMLGAGTPIDPDRNNAQFILRETETWGILQRSIHEDKTSGRPRRYKYYLNRIYCPHLNVTLWTKKDPPYIDDLDEFMASLLKEELPADFAAILDRASRSDRARVALQQTNLFSQH